MSGETQRHGDFAASIPDGAFVIHNEQVKKVRGQDLRSGNRVSEGYGCHKRDSFFIS